MIYDALYVVSDTRPEPLRGTVQLKPVPGGILAFPEDGNGRFLEWDDDIPGTFVDDEKAGTLIVVTSTGSVLFTKEAP